MGTGSRNWTNRTYLQVLAVVAASLVTMATSYVPFETIPGWQIEGDRDFEIEEVSFKAWVAKSGSSGLGITVAARNCGPKTVEVVFLKAEFTSDACSIESSSPATMIALESGEAVHHYLLFLHDNCSQEELEGRAGSLALSFSVDGRREHLLRMPLAFVNRRYTRSYGTSVPGSDQRDSILADIPLKEGIPVCPKNQLATPDGGVAP